jgi:DNA-directed RNA polymerase subunit omega
MARVTIEDCIKEIPNRFELVIVAAQRTRQIFAGAAITITRDNDKYPVVALREIAEKAVDIDLLREDLVKSYRRHIELDESEQEMANMLTQEQGFDRNSFEIGGNSFEEIITEEELAQSFKEDLGGKDLYEESLKDESDDELEEDLEEELDPAEDLSEDDLLDDLLEEEDKKA